MSFESILSAYDDSVSPLNKKIEAAYKEIDFNKNILNQNLISYFKDNEISSFDEVISIFGRDIATKILFKIISSRDLSCSEIMNETVLALLSSSANQLSGNQIRSLEKTFESLSVEDKTHFVFFAQNDTYLSQLPFSKKFLEDFYFIKNTFNKENQISIYGLSFENKVAAIQVSLRKKSNYLIDEFANSLANLFANGYPYCYIDIFEHTLSQYESYYIFYDKEKNSVSIPQKYGRQPHVLSNTGDLVSDFKNVLVFISENLWYE